MEIKNHGFPDGGYIETPFSEIFMDICFNYEDEQGNDCSTIAVAAAKKNNNNVNRNDLRK